jgi:hypothetical protein
MPLVVDTFKAGTIDVTQSITVNGQTVGGLPYKVYTASLTQEGTDNPSAVVLENTLGFEVTWVRESEGEYTLTLPSGTDISKFFIILGINNLNTDGVSISDKLGVQSITINTNAGDDSLSNSGIEIRMYP